MDRESVYNLIDVERNYQDSLGPDRCQTPRKEHSVGEHLVMLDHYVRKAQDEWTLKAGSEASLAQVRKIAAIAVRCMEIHGAPPRQ